MKKEEKLSKPTKPVRLQEDWHYALKLEATERHTSMSRLLEKIVKAHFYPNDEVIH